MEFYIIGSKLQRPNSEKTIFVDASSDNSFRKELDLELSHWFPNKTPIQYKYDTSTEICVSFAEKNNIEEYNLAINNHVDVDGILSVFSLIHNNFAIKNKKELISAAEIGDFWSYGQKKSQILFQGLTLFINSLVNDKADILEIYEQAFKLVFELLEDKEFNQLDINIQNGILALEKSITLIENNQIQRKVITNRFVNYNIPKNISLNNLDKCLKIPSFNEALSFDYILLPQARNFKDKEKIQLVSVEGKNGIYYDLFYPSYIWAETPNLWLTPFLDRTDSTNLSYLESSNLNNVLKILEENETNNGKWVLTKKLTPFSTIKGRNFPVVLSFMQDDIPAESSLSQDFVSKKLSDIFIN